MLRNLFYVQSRSLIKWNRKPRHIGLPKSKLYRIPKRPVLPQEERDELKRLTANYKTHYRSIIEFIKSKYEEKTQTGETVMAEQAEAERDFEERVKLNAEWNAGCVETREARLRAQRALDIEEALAKMSKFEAEERERIAKADEAVRREKELSKTYITESNIDQAIADALASETDFNFAIDLKGNIYKGRTTKPV